ncbi:MAG: hypothetical protein APR53_10130 [Methanoculleus sp. SDB]|nr:MAG: hypothetical protein APR53_10130 [Methanoculleus sp. SDB]
MRFPFHLFFPFEQVKDVPGDVSIALKERDFSAPFPVTKKGCRPEVRNTPGAGYPSRPAMPGRKEHASPLP